MAIERLPAKRKVLRPDVTRRAINNKEQRFQVATQRRSAPALRRTPMVARPADDESASAAVVEVQPGATWAEGLFEAKTAPLDVERIYVVISG